MANSSQRKKGWQKTDRDDQILASLVRSPLTAQEILSLSQTWSQPFTSLRRVQERLKDLSMARQLNSWRYATTGNGAGCFYHKLTLAGYRTLMQDDDIKPPTKRFFEEISPGRHRHQQALSQFIVHTFIAAHYRGIDVIDFYPENTFKIECGERPLFPDARFSLQLPDQSRFTYCVELDNSTERVFSYKENNSITSKMERYLLDRVATSEPYRVLFVVTGAPERKQNILDAAEQLTTKREFPPFYVVSLNDYLSEQDALFAPCFYSPQNERIPLLRSQNRQFQVHRRVLETTRTV